MASTLTFTFTGVGVADEAIDFTGNGSKLVNKPTRQTYTQVTIAKDISRQVENFGNALRLDYNTPLVYEYAITSTTFSITHFDNDHFDDFDDATHNGMSNVTTSVTTTAQKINLSVTPTYTEHTEDKCDNVACNLTFNQKVGDLRIYQKIPNGAEVEIYNDTLNDTEIDIVLDRSIFILHIYATVGGEEIFKSINPTPQKLEITSLDVEENAYGGQVTININSFFGFEDTLFAIADVNALDFSLDYQSSNVISQIAPGDYNAYAKDKYGCVRIKSFTISDQAVNNYEVPLGFFISQKNSTTFKKRDGIRLTANQFNFLAEESPELVPYKGWRNVYAESQVPFWQFKSSYANHSVTVIPCQDTLVNDTLEVTQQTSNINRRTFLEGNLITSNGVLEFFFTPDNELDENGNVIGAHPYDGTLPLWIEVGTQVRIGGTAGVVTGFRTSGVNRVAITSITDTTITSTVIETVHKALDYEVYEFYMNNLEDYIGNDFRLRIIPSQGTIEEEYISELFHIMTDEDFSAGKWHVMEFFNLSKQDRDIDYTPIYEPLTGNQYRIITHLKNVEYEKPLHPVSNANRDVQQLDNKIVTVDYDAIVAYKPFFKRMPQEEAMSLMRLLNETEYVRIDGVLYTTLNPAEIEGDSQLAKVDVLLGVVELPNQRGVVNRNIQQINPYYPASS